MTICKSCGRAFKSRSSIRAELDELTERFDPNAEGLNGRAAAGLLHGILDELEDLAADVSCGLCLEPKYEEGT